MNINTTETEKYIRRLAFRDPSLLEMEEYAKEHHVPIIQFESASLIRTQILLQRPLRLLEIGTAIGYSAIYFAKVSKELKIISLERDGEMFETALKNIQKHGLENRIEVRFGDALEQMRQMIENDEEKFDMIFIDAAKSKYRDFFKVADRLLNNGGLIICDNVLYKGMVADDTILEKKKKSIVYNLRNFMEELHQSDCYATAVLPVGDGVSLSVRLDKERKHADI